MDRESGVIWKVEFIEVLTLWHKLQRIQKKLCAGIAQRAYLQQLQNWWHVNFPLDSKLWVTVAFFLGSSNLIFHFPVCCSVGNSVSTSLGSPSGSRGLLRTAATLILVKWCMWSLQAQQGDEKSISCSDCFVSYMDLVTWSIGHILNLQISLCLHNTRPKIFKWKF